MIHSIQDFSDSQIEELRQCPGVNIDIDKRVAEVPFVAEGLFSAIAGSGYKEQSQAEDKLKPISSDILDDLLFTVIRRTKKDYSKAVIDYARDNHKDVSEGITKVSAEVSRIYKLCKEGKASLDDFKAILEPYYNVRAEAIELYKNEKGGFN